MNELNKLTRTCCSSIMSVLEFTIALVRVFRILILLQDLAKMKMMLDIMFDMNTNTSIAYQPLSISASYSSTSSLVSVEAPIVFEPPYGFSFVSKIEKDTNVMTITVNAICMVFKGFFQIPSCAEKLWLRRMTIELARCMIQTLL